MLAKKGELGTGTRTAVPGVKGLDRAPFTDAETWIGMRELHRRLVIVDGGCVALALGQSVRRFGAEVAKSAAALEAH